MSTAILKLYEVAAELEAIDELLEENGGELTPEIEAKLDAYSAQFAEKIDALLGMRQTAVRLQEAYKSEAARLAARASVAEKKAKSLAQYVRTQMETAKRDVVDTQRFKARVMQNSRPSIEFTGEPETAPKRFRRVRVEVDSNAAYEEWKLMGKLPKGFIVTRGTHLRVW